ncbi:MAG: EcsC family protein [Porticoccaceae bacterium]
MEKDIVDKESNEDHGRLMKFVESIAISPHGARILVKRYESQARKFLPTATDAKIQNLVTDKIIKRYSKLAATSGAVTSIPGIIPGAGTTVSVGVGGLADVSFCMKLQIDMTMCLGIAINDGMSDEDAKHMSYIIALFGALEQMGSSGATRIASKAGVKMINQYLSGATLVAIKALFKKVGISFTQKAASKAIPFGIGVFIGGSANYALTKYIGKTARETFLLDATEKSQAIAS